MDYISVRHRFKTVFAEAQLVAWSFLDKDDWVKKHWHFHRWTRNIAPPTTPKKYDSNAPSFDPGETLGDDWVDDE